MIFGLFVMVLAVSCSRDEDLSDQVENLNWPTDGNSELDQWIRAQFLDPYNIQIRYVWDRVGVSSISNNVVPVKQEQVIPVGNTILRAYLQPYEQVANTQFIKTYPPKEFFFAGSVSYNSNGTVQLGIAEGGRTVILYDLNNYEPSNLSSVTRMLHTIHHEFGHILNQNVIFQTEYGQLSAGSYTGDWNSQSLQTALNAGFITPYSMVNPGEDFVEVLSTLLVEGQGYFDQLLTTAGGNGAQILRQKEQMVVDYYNNRWGIDFRELQRLVQQAIDEIVPANVNDYVGPNLFYTSMTANPSVLPTSSWSSAFLTAFQTYDANVKLINSGFGAGFVEVYLDEVGKMKMRTRTNYPTQNVFFTADYEFDMSKDANGVISFSYLGPYAESNEPNGYVNAVDLEPYSAPLINYFKDQQFRLAWPDGYRTTEAKLEVVGDESSFFLGVLGQLTN